MIKTQLWTAICGCKIMQKWDTENPEVVEYITKEEYLAHMESMKGQPNVQPIEQIKENANKVKICNKHTIHGHTKKLMEEVKKESDIENEKMLKEKKLKEING